MTRVGHKESGNCIPSSCGWWAAMTCSSVIVEESVDVDDESSVRSPSSPWPSSLSNSCSKSSLSCFWRCLFSFLARLARSLDSCNDFSRCFSAVFSAVSLAKEDISREWLAFSGPERLSQKILKHDWNYPDWMLVGVRPRVFINR